MRILEDRENKKAVYSVENQSQYTLEPELSASKRSSDRLPKQASKDHIEVRIRPDPVISLPIA